MRKILWVGLAGCLALGLASSGQSGEQAQLQALVDKGIKAAGGDKALGKFKAGTCKLKGKILEGGKDAAFTFDASLQGTDKVKLDGEVDVQGMQAKATFVLNGDQAWFKMMDKVDEAPKGAITAIKDMTRTFRYAYTLSLLKDKAVTLSALGEVDIDGKRAVGLKVATKDRADIHVFLDKKTSLPLKAEFTFTNKNGGDETLELRFSDYKESNGIKHFSKVVLKQKGKNVLEAEFSGFKWVDKLENSVFEKP